MSWSVGYEMEVQAKTLQDDFRQQAARDRAAAKLIADAAADTNEKARPGWQVAAIVSNLLNRPSKRINNEIGQAEA